VLFLHTWYKLGKPGIPNLVPPVFLQRSPVLDSGWRDIEGARAHRLIDSSRQPGAGKMSGFQFQAPLLTGDESLEKLVGSSALGSLGAPGGGGGAGFGTRSREELELELEAVRGELTETKRELSGALDAYQELQAMYDSRMGRGGDATIVRKQLESEEAEWARERAELLSEVSRLKRQLQARTAVPAQQSAAVSSGSSAGELLTTFAEQFLALDPDFESVAHIEGFRTIFGWCFASWASQELKHRIASGARALARGDMDVKQVLFPSAAPSSTNKRLLFISTFPSSLSHHSSPT
jgi:hypothetical protein